MPYRAQLERLKGRQEVYEKQLAEAIEALERYQRQAIALEEARTFLQSVAQQVQGNVKFRIEDIVNTALSGVFGDRYQFSITFEPKRGKTEASLALLSGGRQLDPLRSNGGGVVDVLTFALRVAVIMISKAPRIMILDEPFKHVSADLRPATYEMVKLLSTKIGMQCIAVSHDKQFIEIADQVIYVALRDGVSEVWH